MISHENNQNRWREFFYDLIGTRIKDILEEPYQEMTEQGMRVQNWSKQKKEICPNERLIIGSHKKLEPDVTFKIDKVPIFVIEVKRPSNKLCEDQTLLLLCYWSKT